MILSLQSRLEDGVRAAARDVLGAELPPVSFQYPPRPAMGDLALTAPFDLARSLRQPPRAIAEKLAPALAALPDVRKAEVAGGGYVNLFLRRGALARALWAALRDPRVPEAPAGRVIVEHTSVNPNKAVHVGHLRNATLGDTFQRALKSRGHQVVVQNYIDDTGVQVADVIVGFLHIEGKTYAEVQALTQQPRFDYYCWDLYARVGDFYAADPPRRALQVRALHDLEKGDDNEVARLGALVAAAILERHLETMRRLGIRYDLLAHESDILRLHFWERAFELLRDKGALRLETEGKNAGCWVLTMDEEGTDEDKILVRSNGIVTYTGKDIAYQSWKLGLLDRDFGYRRQRVDSDGHELWTTTSQAGRGGAPPFGHARAVYNVIDVGQSYPQRVVKAGVAALGGPAAAEASHHLAYEKVVLSPATARAMGVEVSEDERVVKVSGRKGLGVKGDDLLDALVAKARAEIEARDEQGTRTAAETEATSTAIATGALRYFLLKYGRNKIITFDMDEALAFTGETGPYVQNGVVRARSIFAKMEAGTVAAALERARSLDLDTLLEGEEGDEVWSLMMLMARTEEVVEQAVRAEDAAVLAKHAFAVAQAFHSYYQKPRYSVLHAPSDELRAFRVMVVDAFVRQMEALTELLGIPLPERM
jgi:arginyl-tRNA synthetase